MRSRTCREVARRRGPAAGTTKSDSGTSEWCRAPFYPSLAFVSWPRARLAALALTPASAPPSASKRDYGHSRGDGLRLAPNRRLVDA